MTEDLPAPLVPPDVDLRGLPYMPLDVVRLFDSDLYALSTGDEFKAALSLWGKGFLQVPAASLPDDDRVLAHLSGAGPRWRKVKTMALRGWVKCSDGRLYHPVVAEKALQAWSERLAFQERKAERQQVASKAASARWNSDKHAHADAAGMHEHVPEHAESTAEAMHGALQSECRKGRVREQEGKGTTPNPVAPSQSDRAAEVGMAALRLLGWEDDPRKNYGMVYQWLADGCDPDKHIFPVIKASIASGAASKANSLKYFTPAILEARDRHTDTPAANGRKNGTISPSLDDEYIHAIKLSLFRANRIPEHDELHRLSGTDAPAARRLADQLAPTVGVTPP